jgi:hypothetical protein
MSRRSVTIGRPLGYQIPVGGIILWYGDSTDVPNGFEIYSTANDNYIMGASSGNKNTTPAGTTTHSHTLPSSTGTVAAHTHTANTPNTGTPSSNTYTYVTGGQSMAHPSHTHGGTTGVGNSSDGSHSHTLTTSTGTATNLVKYYRLYWIKAV